MRCGVPCFLGGLLFVVSTGCESDPSSEVSSTNLDQGDSESASGTGSSETQDAQHGGQDASPSTGGPGTTNADVASVPDADVASISDETASSTLIDEGSAVSADTELRPDGGSNGGASLDAAASQPSAAPEPDAAVWPPALVTAPEAVAEAENRFDSLERCAVASACPIVIVDADGYDNGALRCVLGELAQVTTGALQHRDTHGDTIRDTVLFLRPGRIAEVSMRETSANPGEPAFSSRLFCSVAASSSFQECLQQLPEDAGMLSGEPACSNPASWFTACTEADLPDVPCGFGL